MMKHLAIAFRWSCCLSSIAVMLATSGCGAFSFGDDDSAEERETSDGNDSSDAVDGDRDSDRDDDRDGESTNSGGGETTADGGEDVTDDDIVSVPCVERSHAECTQTDDCSLIFGARWQPGCEKTREALFCVPSGSVGDLDGTSVAFDAAGNCWQVDIAADVLPNGWRIEGRRVCPPPPACEKQVCERLRPQPDFEDDKYGCTSVPNCRIQYGFEFVELGCGFGERVPLYCGYQDGEVDCVGPYVVAESDQGICYDLRLCPLGYAGGQGLRLHRLESGTPGLGDDAAAFDKSGCERVLRCGYPICENDVAQIGPAFCEPCPESPGCAKPEICWTDSVRTPGCTSVMGSRENARESCLESAFAFGRSNAFAEPADTAVARDVSGACWLVQEPLPPGWQVDDAGCAHLRSLPACR